MGKHERRKMACSASKAEKMRAAWADPERRAAWLERIRAAARTPEAQAKRKLYLASPEGREHVRKMKAGRWAGHVRMTREEKLLVQKLRDGGLPSAVARSEMWKLREARHA